MPNHVKIQRTQFISPSQGNTTYGYRMYDDHGQTYDDALTQEEMNDSDEKLLIRIWNYGDDVAFDMLDFVTDGHGIYIDDRYHDWDWVRNVLDFSE